MIDIMKIAKLDDLSVLSADIAKQFAIKAREVLERYQTQG